MILDLIFVVIIILSVIYGKKKGIIKTALGLSSTLVSIVASLLLYNPFMKFVEANEKVSGWIVEIKSKIANAVLPSISIAPGEETPEFLKYILTGELLEKGNNAIARAVADAVVYIFIILTFIVIIKLLVSILFKLLNATAKLPVIKQANGLVGALLGLAIGVIGCFVVAALLTVFMGNGSWIATSLKSSYFAKYFFETNFLLNKLF